MTSGNDFEASKQAVLEMLSKQEDLHEDLVPYLYDHPRLSKVLQHPLVYSVPYAPLFNAHTNRLYLQKKRQIAEAIKAKEWGHYIMLHERAWRLHALLEIRDKMDDDAYWEMVGTVWTDSENIYQNMDEWLDIWDEDRPGREKCMDAKERVRLHKLPAIVKVYRGVCYEESIHGLSWTTNLAKAKWFARRFSSPKDGRIPTLVTGTLSRDDVYALFLGRDENEVVALPDAVTIKSIKAIELKD